VSPVRVIRIPSRGSEDQAVRTKPGPGMVAIPLTLRVLPDLIPGMTSDIAAAHVRRLANAATTISGRSVAGRRDHLSDGDRRRLATMETGDRAGDDDATATPVVRHAGPGRCHSGESGGAGTCSDGGWKLRWSYLSTVCKNGQNAIAVLRQLFTDTARIPATGAAP
jgi:hypothetical protein